MSRHEPETRGAGPAGRRGGVRGYLRRFFTSWVAEDPEPTYSSLDRADGLGQAPDPVCRAGTEVPEAAEVADHRPMSTGPRRAVAGRSGR